MRHNLSVALALVEEYSCNIWALVLGLAAFVMIIGSLVSVASGFAYVNMAVQHGQNALGLPYAHDTGHMVMKAAMWFAYAIFILAIGCNTARTAYQQVSRPK
jgi:uncharacterized membrane protein YkgB